MEKEEEEASSSSVTDSEPVSIMEINGRGMVGVLMA